VVNVASQCGFTPQYEGLEALQRKHAAQGFSVLGFPCDQFGHQEPGSDDEIKTFCESRYSVTFPLFSKIDVNGNGAHPLYRFLRGGTAADEHPIKWNFTKFLVDREGRVARRFESAATPESIDRDIELALGKR
jgi:glutathione peroxidase